MQLSFLPPDASLKNIDDFFLLSNQDKWEVIRASPEVIVSVAESLAVQSKSNDERWNSLEAKIKELVQRILPCHFFESFEHPVDYVRSVAPDWINYLKSGDLLDETGNVAHFGDKNKFKIGEANYNHTQAVADFKFPNLQFMLTKRDPNVLYLPTEISSIPSINSFFSIQEPTLDKVRTMENWWNAMAWTILLPDLNFQKPMFISSNGSWSINSVGIAPERYDTAEVAEIINKIFQFQIDTNIRFIYKGWKELKERIVILDNKLTLTGPFHNIVVESGHFFQMYQEIEEELPTLAAQLKLPEIESLPEPIRKPTARQYILMNTLGGYVLDLAKKTRLEYANAQLASWDAEQQSGNESAATAACSPIRYV